MLGVEENSFDDERLQGGEGDRSRFKCSCLSTALQLDDNYTCDGLAYDKEGPAGFQHNTAIPSLSLVTAVRFQTNEWSRTVYMRSRAMPATNGLHRSISYARVVALVALDSHAETPRSLV